MQFKTISKKWERFIYITKIELIGINTFCILPPISIAQVEAGEQEWGEITRYSEERWWLD